MQQTLQAEHFVDEDQSKQAIGNTFITLSFVFLGMVLASLLLWSYQKTDSLFIAIFSLMVLVYALMMVIFIVIVRSKLTVYQFKVFITVSIFMSLCSLSLFVYFVIKAIQFFKRSGIATASYQQRNTPYVPQNLVGYANAPMVRQPSFNPEYNPQRTNSPGLM
jgi:glucan phosphoethanolaminetransferase (alkaline phosphatase superfamily)